jgi:hypothetical protein
MTNWFEHQVIVGELLTGVLLACAVQFAISFVRGWRANQKFDEELKKLQDQIAEGRSKSETDTPERKPYVPPPISSGTLDEWRKAR